MRLHLLANFVLASFLTAAAIAAPPIELELATERGLQITAPHQWLQLFASLGLENVRIRAATPADKPSVDNRGTAEQPQFHVLGILTSRDELRLPGGTFRAEDHKKLADYFARLTADGADALTAQRGRFGLTEKEITAAHADLAQPVDFTTKGLPLRAVLDRMQAKFTQRLAPDADALQIIHTAKPVAEEIRNLTAGTGLAIVLRSYGLALRPEKAVGKPVALRIVSIDSTDDSWPIGWESQASPRETAPALFEFLNVEIDGYTAAEALDAIQPRVKIPFFIDHYALAKHGIKLEAAKVTIPRTRTFYKRVLDRVLAQARLAGKLRVDEAGTPFLWITK